MRLQQEIFVREYLIDFNATQAAKRAGYSAKTAGSKGEQLLKVVEIKKAIDAALAEYRKRNEVTVEYVISGLRTVAERCLQRAPVMDMKGEQVQDEEGRNVWKFDSAGANKALETLGKHLGMFTEKIQMSVAVTPASILAELDRRRENTKNE